MEIRSIKSLIVSGAGLTLAIWMICPIAGASVIIGNGEFMLETLENGPDQIRKFASRMPENEVLNFVVPGRTAFRAEVSRADGLITVDDATGCAGDTIVIEILLNNPEEPVDAFMFDLNYDTGALSYISCSEGSLIPTGGWVGFGCNEGTAGTIVAGGFAVNSIPTGSTGSIVRITFDVTCSGCLQNEPFSMTLTRLQDDLSGYTAVNGTFTYYCAPTATPTFTNTPTLTPTGTPTNTPTNAPTDTPAPTNTATNTQTNTPTPTTPLSVPTTGPSGLGLMLVIVGILIVVPAFRRK